MKKFFVFLALLFSTLFSFSQQVIPCGTDEIYQQQKMKNPWLEQIEQEANIKIRQEVNSVVMSKAGTIRYIPVVFHIIHGNGFENITQAQVMDAIRVLNEDYRKMAGTNGFSDYPIAADMEIEFRLAQYDPNGNKHDGINRIYNPTLDSNADDNTKALITWDSKKYLNVWVVNSINSSSTGGNGIVLGYAQFPWQLSSQGSTDGIIIRADQIGKAGIADPGQAGRTLTHEIGHWLGLYHTFQGGCTGNTSGNCGSAGDQVCDTPPVSAASFGCQTGKNSCTNDVPDSADLIKDYMDYSDGICMNLYTEGQKTRVNSCRTYRQSIFGASPTYSQNVTYAGINTDGSYTTVAAASVKAPYTYGFDDGNPVSNGWKINNFNNPGNGWQVNSSVSHSGGKSMYMKNFTNSLAKVNSRDGFQTPEIDLSGLIFPTLEFYYAYCQKSTASNDSFIVRISNDFGMHEVQISRDAGASMSTGGIQTTEYFPASQDWRKVTVDLSPYVNYTHARIRFELLNRRGNNIYVDDISVFNGLVGLEDLKSELRFQVYPNPMTDKTTISFLPEHKINLKISIMDLMGKVVMDLDPQEFSNQNHAITISRDQLKSGLYLIRVESDKSFFTHKLLIN